MDSHGNETTNELLRMMWQQLVVINQRIEGTNTRLDSAVVRLDTRITETNTTLRAFMRQTHENFDRIDRHIVRLDERIDETNKSLSARIDETNKSLSARIDETNATLKELKQQTSENFGRVQRNFEKVNVRLEGLDTGQTRMNELDERLTRVETHVGLRDE
jgi:methyl-accepting chemotaxis protein